jgi:polar amino acid transport system permease protein
MDPLARFLDAFLNPKVAATYAPLILEGVVLTIQLAVLVVVAGIGLGLVLAVLRSLAWRPLDVLIVLFADVMRALPPLVLILFVYFGLPTVGVPLSGFATVWLVLTLVLAAFAEEIFWAGVTSIPKGQWEAARSTGIGHLRTVGHVIMPQAIRLTIPPLTNRTIAITKNTALGSVIGLGEILNQATTAQAFSGNATPLTLGAIAYLIVFLPVVILSRWVETRFAWRH